MVPEFGVSANRSLVRQGVIAPALIEQALQYRVCLIFMLWDD